MLYSEWIGLTMSSPEIHQHPLTMAAPRKTQLRDQAGRSMQLYGGFIKGSFVRPDEYLIPLHFAQLSNVHKSSVSGGFVPSPSVL